MIMKLCARASLTELVLLYSVLLPLLFTFISCSVSASMDWERAAARLCLSPAPARPVALTNSSIFQSAGVTAVRRRDNILFFLFLPTVRMLEIEDHL